MDWIVYIVWHNVEALNILFLKLYHLGLQAYCKIIEHDRIPDVNRT